MPMSTWRRARRRAPLRLLVLVALVLVLAQPVPAGALVGPPIHPDNRASAVPGQSNGRLDPRLLRRVAPGCVIWHQAAGSMVGLLRSARLRGIDLQPLECYRDYAGQVAARQTWCQRGLCQFAAVPGTSKHGWAKAVDLRATVAGPGPTGGVDDAMTFDDPGYTFMTTDAWWFGVNHPGWAEPGGSAPEPWHWEWVGDGGTLWPGLWWSNGVGVSLPADAHDPFGSIGLVAGGRNQVRVAGWAIDPDTRDPVDVHVYVDGVGVNLGAAGTRRADVGLVYPGWGDGHGFDATIAVGPGRRQVCAFAIDRAGPGANRLLGCVAVDVAGQPIGALDVVARVPGGVRVAGWALDQDTPAEPVDVHVYADGRGWNTGPADGLRPDVAAALPPATAERGVDVVLPVGEGTHRVCAFGIDRGVPGAAGGLGCRSVTVTSSPRGAFDLAAVTPPAVADGPATLRVAGWAIDPDTDDPVDVHLYVDGAGWNLGPAATPRPDVARATPGWSEAHGFDATVEVPAGARFACVAAIDRVAPGTTTWLGCRPL